MGSGHGKRGMRAHVGNSVPKLFDSPLKQFSDSKYPVLRFSNQSSKLHQEYILVCNSMSPKCDRPQNEREQIQFG